MEAICALRVVICDNLIILESEEEALRKRGTKFTNVHSDIITGANDY